MAEKKRKSANIDLNSLTSIVNSLEDNLSEVEKKKLFYRLKNKIHPTMYTVSAKAFPETSRGKIAYSFILVTIFLLFLMLHFSPYQFIGKFIKPTDGNQLENLQTSLKFVEKPPLDTSSVFPTDNIEINEDNLSKIKIKKEQEINKLNVLNMQIRNNEKKLEKISELISIENIKYDSLLLEKKENHKKIAFLKDKIFKLKSYIRELEEKGERAANNQKSYDLLGVKISTGYNKNANRIEKLETELKELILKKEDYETRQEEIGVQPEEVNSYIHLLSNQKKELEADMEKHNKLSIEIKQQITSLSQSLERLEKYKKIPDSSIE
jgi:hypothetical protein